MIESLTQLIGLMRHYGASRVYAKKLSPNDNSKNQVYLGGGFSALNVIPHGEVYTDTRTLAGSKRDRPKANVRFFWVDGEGKHPAPSAQLILYPDYPEIRMSGFLKGCEAAPSRLFRGRETGRILILGVTAEGSVLGHAVDATHPIAAEINAGKWEELGVFLELPSAPDRRSNPRTILLAELKRIYELRWIQSQKLAANGLKVPYRARNGGGYTLEAELGITPNGYSEPDFMGWEVKQFGVTDFERFTPKTPITLMTPEPTGGLYKTNGIAEFMRRFSYADKRGKADRLNFGGIYTCNKDCHADTGLRITVDGFDSVSGKITSLEGGIVLRTRDGEDAAAWSFKGLMEHWNRKHAQAAYVPSLFRDSPPQYAYGPQVLLCEQTDFILFLKAFASGIICYDPAIKMEGASSARPVIKRRSQFRVKHQQITNMYHHHETVSLFGK